MQPEIKTKSKADKALVRRILTLFGPHKADIVKICFAVFFGVLLGIVPAILVQIIIDKGFQLRDLNVIIYYSLYTVLAVLAASGFTLLYGYLSVVMGQKIMCDLRQKLFDHLQGMSLKFFTQTRTGDIQTRLLSDIQGVQGVVSNTLTDQLSNLAIVVSTLAAMIYMDWRLTLLSIGMIPFFALFGKWVGNFARDVRKGTQEETSELNAMMQETLSVSGILLTKTAGKQSLMSERFLNQNQILAKWQIKSSVVQYLFFGMIRIITQLAPSLVYWLAGWLLIKQGDTSVTVGKLVAFAGLQTRMFFPLTGLLSAQVEIMSSFALFERIFQYLDLKHDITDSKNCITLAPKDVVGSIEFENVGFSYEEGGHTLSNISFKAEAGQLVALVGPSGSGKTSLTYLIPRLYDPTSGVVRLDGHDLKDIKLSSLSEIVGAVTQETYLMHTTIAENLRVAKPGASLDELIEACKIAAIHDHIDSLPEKYETIVGERGYKLSGGEKQRIAIARTVLKNPRILILDEATSALDTHSERLVQNALNQLQAGRTTFAIAHRLSTILGADLILVMRDGQIVEKGNHQELVAQEGLYASLYQEQFAVQETAAEAEPVS